MAKRHPKGPVRGARLRAEKKNSQVGREPPEPQETRAALLRLERARFEILEHALDQALKDPAYCDLPPEFIIEAFRRWALLSRSRLFRKDVERLQEIWRSYQDSSPRDRWVASPQSRKRRAWRWRRGFERLEKEKTRIAAKWGLAKIPGIGGAYPPTDWWPGALSIVMAFYPPGQYDGFHQQRFLRLLLDLHYPERLLLKDVKAWIARLRPEARRPLSRRRLANWWDQYRVFALRDLGLTPAEIADHLWPDDYRAAKTKYPQRNKVLQRVTDILKAARRTLAAWEAEARASKAKRGGLLGAGG